MMSMQATRPNPPAAAPRTSDAATTNAAPAPTLPPGAGTPAATPFATYWNARADGADTHRGEHAPADDSATDAPADADAAPDTGSDEPVLAAMNSPVLLPTVPANPIVLPMMPAFADPAFAPVSAGAAAQSTPDAAIAAPQAPLADARALAPAGPRAPVPGSVDGIAPSAASLPDGASLQDARPAPARPSAAATPASAANALPVAAFASALTSTSNDSALPARVRAQADAMRGAQGQAGTRGAQPVASNTTPAAPAPIAAGASTDTPAGSSGQAGANGEASGRAAASLNAVADAGEQPASVSGTPPAGAFGMAAPSAAAPSNAAPLTLAGAPQQWQQSLREALGERLQTQVTQHGEQAVIRLDPPNLGRIEIAIRHSAGMLQVSVSASHGDVLRQLHTISDSVRQDLARGQFSEVSLVVSATPRGAQAFGDGGGRQRHDGKPDDQATPGRALSDHEYASSTFAMQPDRE